MSIIEIYERTRYSVYSDFDHQLDQEVAQQLKSGEVYAQHAGGSFCGYVYFKDGMWFEEIWQYNEHIETLSDKDLKTLICEAIDRFGAE